MAGAFITYTVKYGDTIQDVAQATTGDASNWVEIATINNLDYPYFTNGKPSDPSLNLKNPGDTILIPTDVTQIDPSLIPNFEYQSIYDRALGQDIDLFPSNPVRLVYTDGGEISADAYGDLSIVSGLTNLRQSLILRLMTPIGSLLYHPEYGTNLYQYLGKSAVDGSMQMLKTEIMRTIKTDSRVADVQVKSAVLYNNIAQIEVHVQPVGFDIAFKMKLSFGPGGVLEWD